MVRMSLHNYWNTGPFILLKLGPRRHHLNMGPCPATLCLGLPFRANTQRAGFEKLFIRYNGVRCRLGAS